MVPEHDAARPPRTAIERRRDIALSGHSGDIERATVGLGDPEARVRSGALRALARAGSLDASTLVGALADNDAGVRRTAAELGPTGPGYSVTPGLLNALNDPDPMVAEMAAWALGEGSPGIDVVTALASMAIRHGDALCREAAVAALGALGDPAGLSAILSATTDKPAIRRRAVLALAPFEGAEVTAALERALGDRDWQVRQAAEDLQERRLS